MSSAKSQALTSPLKSSLEAAGAQVKLEAAVAGVTTPGASLPNCTVRSLLQDMGLQVINPTSLTVASKGTPHGPIITVHLDQS